MDNQYGIKTCLQYTSYTSSHSCTLSGFNRVFVDVVLFFFPRVHLFQMLGFVLCSFQVAVSLASRRNTARNMDCTGAAAHWR